MSYIETVRKLIKKKLKISVAESITGGLIAKMITDVPGSSEIFSESFVTYSNESKISILGIDNKNIETFGVVSAEVAKDMAICLMDKTKVDISVSTSGNAGPTVCDDKPVGRAYIGIAYKAYNKDSRKIDNYVQVVEMNVKTNYEETEDSIFENRNLVRNEIAKRTFEEIERIIENGLV